MGYPEKLSAHNLFLFAKMGAVCDVYDAITSNSSYKDSWSPAKSIRKMTSWNINLKKVSGF
jgi:HD-GYP domain-containing protein (c-di-GMP phosphodiesterase class II)